MSTNFDIITDRANTWSLKWDYNDSIFGRKDIIPMWVADMDFPSPPEIIEAIKKRADHGLFGYTKVSEQYDDTVIKWMEKRHNWFIKEQWLTHSPGVVSSIDTAILAFSKVGDKVLIQTPLYHCIHASVLENERQLVTNPLKCSDGFYSIDFEDLDDKLKSGVNIMILCSPHNPIGRVWSRQELTRISELCIKHKVLLVSDEIHSDIVYKEHKHIPIASISEEMSQNSITCISTTKTFNLAGLAESLVIIPNKTIQNTFQKTLNRTGADMINIFGMIAAEAAFKYGEEWLEDLIEYLQGNLNILTDYINKNISAIKVIKPEGTYLAWLDCKTLLKDERKLREFFVKQAGVGLNDGIIFGTDGSGFQRINFACPRTMLLDGLQRIEGAVKSL
jgi:cysteine-S-conjugate beta-lyase